MQDETAHTIQDDAIDISSLPPKQAAMAILVENGLSTEDAGKALGYTKGTAYVVKTKLNKLSLKHPKMVKSAASVVKNILSGQPFGAVDKIKDSTALQAAQMVYDRVEPAIRQTANLNLNCDISPVDLEAYRR